MVVRGAEMRAILATRTIREARANPSWMNFSHGPAAFVLEFCRLPASWKLLPVSHNYFSSLMEEIKCNEQQFSLPFWH
jgi:hypothetical protein